MHGFLKLIKTTLIGGALVVLPAWIVILLLLKLLVKMEVIVKPVSSHLPRSVAHPQIIAIVLMILACFLVGMVIRTAFGRGIKTAVEVIDSVQCTVFIPSAPTLAAGSILIVSSYRVHPVDVPVTKLFKIVTKWGTGCRELLAALPKDSPPSNESPRILPASFPPNPTTVHHV